MHAHACAQLHALQPPPTHPHPNRSCLCLISIYWSAQLATTTFLFLEYFLLRAGARAQRGAPRGQVHGVEAQGTATQVHAGCVCLPPINTSYTLHLQERRGAMDG